MKVDLVDAQQEGDIITHDKSKGMFYEVIEVKQVGSVFRHTLKPNTGQGTSIKNESVVPGTKVVLMGRIGQSAGRTTKNFIA
jgi:hypothetical protein